jgi:hypothetical protein
MQDHPFQILKDRIGKDDGYGWIARHAAYDISNGDRQTGQSNVVHFIWKIVNLWQAVKIVG